MIAKSPVSIILCMTLFAPIQATLRRRKHQAARTTKSSVANKKPRPASCQLLNDMDSMIMSLSICELALPPVLFQKRYQPGKVKLD